jgi:hypothetical protein
MASMKEIRNAYRPLVGKYGDKIPFGNFSVNAKIILKWVLNSVPTIVHLTPGSMHWRRVAIA